MSHLRTAALSAVCACVMASAAFAEDASAPAPADALPAMPDPNVAPALAAEPVAATPQQTIAMPPLPPSRPCQKKDVVGAWMLQKMYESPLGAETEALKTQPYEYRAFGQKDHYRLFRTPQFYGPRQVWAEILRKPDDVLRQYVVHESGIVFFYNDGVVTGSLACFIVANPRGEFKVGQMLLMPPINEAKNTRMIKIYTRIVALQKRFGGSARPPAANRNARQTNDVSQTSGMGGGLSR